MATVCAPLQQCVTNSSVWSSVGIMSGALLFTNQALVTIGNRACHELINILNVATTHKVLFTIFCLCLLKDRDRFLKGFLLPQSIRSFFELLLIGLHLDAKEFSLGKHMVLRACTKVPPNWDSVIILHVQIRAVVQNQQTWIDQLIITNTPG